MSVAFWVQSKVSDIYEYGDIFSYLLCFLHFLVRYLYLFSNILILIGAFLLPEKQLIYRLSMYHSLGPS